jgi:hypothetical protein
MAALTLLLLLTPLLPLSTTHSLAPLLDRRDYADTVCKPPTKSPTDTVPPCVEIETIETLCTPNGTDPLYLAAHQQCMCGGSFFTEWPSCQACLLLHGLRSERDVARYDSLLSAASSSFCDPAATPTAVFAEVFSSLDGPGFPVPTTGATVSSDRAPGETAVSLYYTASGSQGPGRITGAAAGATATRLVTAPAAGTTGTTGVTGGAGGMSNPGTTPTTGPTGPSTKPNAGGVVGVSWWLGGVVGLVVGVVVGL